MQEPSQKSIKRVLDMLTSYMIIKRHQVQQGEFLESVVDEWEEEIQPCVEYLNWIAYRNESWYKEAYIGD